MIQPDDDVPPNLHNRALPLLLIAVSLALGWILLPFYGAILGHRAARSRHWA